MNARAILEQLFEAYGEGTGAYAPQQIQLRQSGGYYYACLVQNGKPIIGWRRLDFQGVDRSAAERAAKQMFGPLEIAA